jgi:hypothetical protein
MVDCWYPPATVNGCVSGLTQTLRSAAKKLPGILVREVHVASFHSASQQNPVQRFLVSRVTSDGADT